MSDIKVVDLSHHNPEPDWAKMKASGVVGVILKATEGTDYVDPTFGGRADDAENAGLAVASYHFLHGGQIEAQMQFYIDTVAPERGERLCLDHEADATLEELERAVEYLLAHTSCEVAVYSGHLLKDQLGDGYNGTLAEYTSLWLAQYSEPPEWSKGTYQTWSLWQFTDKATVPGCTQGVDGNRWNGSDDNLVTWFYRDRPPPPAPQPEPQNKYCTVSIDADPGVTVSIIVNGKLWKE